MTVTAYSSGTLDGCTYTGDMSAQPVHEAMHDPQVILKTLPEKWRAQFLAEYEAAVDAARRPERYRQLHELLHVWWLKSIALSDPDFEARQQEALEDVRTGRPGIPLEAAVPDWEERLARTRGRRRP